MHVDVAQGLGIRTGTTGATTTNLPLKAIDISQDPENSDVGSANTNVLVVTGLISLCSVAFNRWSSRNITNHLGSIKCCA